MPSCPNCRRRFRSKAAYALYLKQRAVILDLQGITPAEHLRPPGNYTISPADLDKHVRHQADSQAHRNGQV